MGHDVAGDDVVPGFGAALRVERTAHVAQVAEDVEGVDHEGEITLKDALGKAGVPDELVGVHAALFVAASAVEGQVGAQLDAAGYGDAGREAVVEVDGVDGGESLAAAAGVGPVGAHFEPGAPLLVGEVELERLVDVGLAHDAACRGGGAADTEQVDAVGEARAGDGAKQEVLLRPQVAVERQGAVHPPVAVDVLGADGVAARRGVVSLAHGHLVAHGAAAQLQVEETDVAPAAVLEGVQLYARLVALRAVEVRIAALHVEGIGVVHDVQLVEHVWAPHRIIVIHCQVGISLPAVPQLTHLLRVILHAGVDVGPQAVTVGEVGAALVAQAFLVDVERQREFHLVLPAVVRRFDETGEIARHVLFGPILRVLVVLQVEGLL